MENTLRFAVIGAGQRGLISLLVHRPEDGLTADERQEALKVFEAGQSIVEDGTPERRNQLMELMQAAAS